MWWVIGGLVAWVVWSMVSNEWREGRLFTLEREARLRQQELDKLQMAVRAHRKTLIDIADSAGFGVDECSGLLDHYLKQEHNAYLEGRRQTLGAGTNGKHHPSSGGKT
jgi:hypothetical protein